MYTENIISIYKDYLNTRNTHYAILINGGWGCGKTYFWNYSLDKIAKENGFKTIYLSLNGIGKIESLEHLLFLKLMLHTGKEEKSQLKNVVTLSTNILNAVSKKYFATSLVDVFKNLSVDSFPFKNYVICFDDIERCQIPIKEVLGFINNFVEHKGLKTIILGDEPKIDPAQKGQGYDNIKEKVIGRILNFELDITNTLPYLFEKYKSQNIDYYDFLISHQKTLVSILTDYKQDNLRIISFFLDTLEKLFPFCKDVGPRTEQEILLFSAIISIEFKIGKLNSTDYNDYKGLDSIGEQFYSLSLIRAMNKTKKEEPGAEKSDAEKFYDKYLENRVKEYFFYPSVYTYILTGYLNQSEFEKEIKKREPEIISEAVQDFRTLLDYKFRELSDTDFQRLTKDVLNFAKEGKYSIYDYIQIAGFFYYFSDNKLIPESKEVINTTIIEGLDIAKRRKEIIGSILENLLHFTDDNPEVEKIKQKVEKIHKEIEVEKFVTEGKEFIDCLANNDEFALAKLFDKYKVTVHIFQFIDSSMLFKTILNISNKQLFNFTELLQDRYKSTNIGEFLHEDSPCLIKLQKDLAEYLNKDKDLKPLRRFLFNALIEALKTIINHLLNTKKK